MTPTKLTLLLLLLCACFAFRNQPTDVGSLQDGEEEEGDDGGAAMAPALLEEQEEHEKQERIVEEVGHLDPDREEEEEEHDDLELEEEDELPPPPDDDSAAHAPSPTAPQEEVAKEIPAYQAPKCGHIIRASSVSRTFSKGSMSKACFPKKGDKSLMTKCEGKCGYVAKTFANTVTGNHGCVCKVNGKKQESQKCKSLSQYNPGVKYWKKAAEKGSAVAEGYAAVMVETQLEGNPMGKEWSWLYTPPGRDAQWVRVKGSYIDPDMVFLPSNFGFTINTKDLKIEFADDVLFKDRDKDFCNPNVMASYVSHLQNDHFMNPKHKDTKGVFSFQLGDRQGVEDAGYPEKTCTGGQVKKCGPRDTTKTVNAIPETGLKCGHLSKDRRKKACYAHGSRDKDKNPCTGECSFKATLISSSCVCSDGKGKCKSAASYNPGLIKWSHDSSAGARVFPEKWKVKEGYSAVAVQPETQEWWYLKIPTGRPATWVKMNKGKLDPEDVAVNDEVQTQMTGCFARLGVSAEMEVFKTGGQWDACHPSVMAQYVYCLKHGV